MIKSNLKSVERVYEENPTLAKYMKFFDEKDTHWLKVANDLILKAKENPRVQPFYDSVHSAKVKVERRMRTELDRRLTEMGPCRLMDELGNNLVKRLRLYIKMLASKDSVTLGKIAYKLIKSDGLNRD